MRWKQAYHQAENAASSWVQKLRKELNAGLPEDREFPWLLPFDNDSPEKPPVCPRCGTDSVKEPAPRAERVTSGVVLSFLILFCVLMLVGFWFGVLSEFGLVPAARPNTRCALCDLVYAVGFSVLVVLAIRVLLRVLGGRRPKRYQCAECGHQFLYPPVYRDDLPSESVLKQQRSRVSLKTDSPQAQTKK